MPTAAGQRRFRQEMPALLNDHERPGLVSRFTHTGPEFVETRGDVEVGNQSLSLSCLAASPGRGGARMSLSSCVVEMGKSQRSCTPPHPQQYSCTQASCARTPARSALQHNWLFLPMPSCLSHINNGRVACPNSATNEMRTADETALQVAWQADQQQA